jgi:uncharacterized protein (DUF488 family)
MSVLFTIGHSTHPIEEFLGLLEQNGVTALADVRSHPYSRHFPQYSQDALKTSLAKHKIAYVFLGKELGARSENPACYRHGKVKYELLAKEPLFAVGLDRLKTGMDRYRIALMCAEKDPLDCHRAVLVARRVHELGTPVEHIHADSHLETQAEMESRMLQLLKMSDTDMFKSRDEIVADAYCIRGEQIAYKDEAMLNEETGDRRHA